MQETTTQGMGKAASTRPNAASDVGNVRNRESNTVPRRIVQISAYARGVRAGAHEDETGIPAECPYTMKEMIEDFWRGVRAGAIAPPPLESNSDYATSVSISDSANAKP